MLEAFILTVKSNVTRNKFIITFFLNFSVQSYINSDIKVDLKKIDYTLRSSTEDKFVQIPIQILSLNTKCQ